MKVNYILMYGTPYLTYKPFERFEDMSKYMVNKSIVDYKIFAHLEDIKEIEMIYRDSDIHFLENLVKEKDKEIERLNQYIDFYKDLTERQNKDLERLNNIINELEKDIIKKINDIKNNYSQVNGNYFNMNYVLDTYEDVLNKLQELKGDGSNE